MQMSLSRLLGRVLAPGALLAASLAVASPAQAAFDLHEIPTQERAPTGEYGQNHCAKIEIVYARGTTEAAGGSFALNGVNSYGASDRYLSTSIWSQVVTELGNRTITYNKAGVGMVTEREYTPVYPYDLSIDPELWGRSDFTLYNLPYPASTDFITSTSPTNSVQVGTINLVNHLVSENVRCPQKKFMLFGYSQGALVVANAISLQTMRKYWYGSSYTPYLMYPVHSKIVSVGLMADAGFNSTETITVGGHPEYDRATYGSTVINAPGTIQNGTRQDLNGRRNTSSIPLGVIRGKLEEPGVGTPQGLRAPGTYFSTFSNSTGSVNKVRSYCIPQDPVCNRSSTISEAHFYYFGDPAPRKNLSVFAVENLRKSDPRWSTASPSLSVFPQFGLPDTTLIP